MSKTIEDLKTAFAGESQANRRYLAFAKQAEEEGYPRLPSCCRGGQSRACPEPPASHGWGAIDCR